MAKDYIREVLEETAVAMINKILDYMDENKQNEITRESLIFLRDEFKSKCDMT